MVKSFFSVVAPKRAVLYKSQYYIHNHQDGWTKKRERSTNKRVTASKKSKLMLILVRSFLMSVSATKLVMKLQAAVNQDPPQTLINH